MIERTPLLLPCFIKVDADPRPDPEEKLHPIGKILRGRRFGQAALGMSIGLAISTAWFRFDSQVFTPWLLSVIIAGVLTAAAAAVWNVKFVAKLFPAVAVAIEKAALAALFFPFFAVVNALLVRMQVIGWIPWGCLVVSVMIMTSVRVSRPQMITFKALDWVR